MSAHDAAAAYDHRYTDRDVREDPRLVDLAIAYLQTYGGDFEPLVEAQVYLRDHGTALPTALVRKVLNCMRHDFTVAGALPTPQRPVLRVVVPCAVPARRQVAPEPPRRRPFELRTTWKKPYLESTALQATVTHTLDVERSTITYFPQGVGSPFAWRPRPLCPGPSGRGTRLVDEPSPGRVPCKTCARVARDRAERAERAERAR